MNHRHPMLCAIALLALAVPTLHAADVPTDLNTDLVNVIITAEGRPRLQSESIASSTIITAHDLEAQGAQTVADALRTVPGVAIIQNGQDGALATVQIRGTRGTQALVLIDGQRISSPAFMGTDMSKFPVSDISRIEIIRGPVSSLYGSEAFGGVINIITKRPVGTGGELGYSYGNHGRTQRSIDVSDGDEKLIWQFNASAPGFNASRPNSDFVAADYTGRVQLTDIAGWNFTVRAEHYHDALGVVGSVNSAPTDERQWWLRDDLSLSATRTLDNGTLTVNIHSLRQETEDRATFPYAYSSNFRGNTISGDIRYARTLGAHQLVAGLETRTDGYRDLEVPGTGVDLNINNRAIYLEDRWGIAKDTSVVLGARQDQHSAAGVHFTPRIGVSQNMGDGLVLRTSYSEGFRAPNFTELYTSSFGTKGNPNLAPETSRSFEVGAAYTQKNNNYDIVLFSNRVTDQITWVPDVAPFTYTYKNIARVNQQGVETNWNHIINRDWKTGMSYSYLEANDSDTGTRLVRLPHNKVSLSVTGNVAEVWNTTLTGRFTDQRPDLSFDSNFVGTNVMLPSRAVFDLNITRSRFALDKENKVMLSPFLMIRNIANTPGDEIADYPSESRSAEIGIRLYW
ncbi:MAG: TonB-dependent receptor [bacterium]